MAFCKLVDWQTKMEYNPGGWASSCCRPASAGRRWALACPLGLPREEASREFFCGLPELKVNVRGQKTAGGGGQHSQGLCSGFSGGGGGSKPGAPSSHLILCCSLFLLQSIFPSIRVFSSESAVLIRWPKYWSFSFSISLSNAVLPHQ